MEEQCVPVLVPEKCSPVYREVVPCACALEPVPMTYRKGSIHWVASGGDEVKSGQLLCEGTYESKLFEFRAPADGELMIVHSEGEAIRKGDLLAYILT